MFRFRRQEKSAVRSGCGGVVRVGFACFARLGVSKERSHTRLLNRPPGFSKSPGLFVVGSRPPTTPQISPPSNRKFRTDLALGNRANRYISPMRIQSFRARWGFLYPPRALFTLPSLGGAATGSSEGPQRGQRAGSSAMTWSRNDRRRQPA